MVDSKDSLCFWWAANEKMVDLAGKQSSTFCVQEIQY